MYASHKAPHLLRGANTLFLPATCISAPPALRRLLVAKRQQTQLLHTTQPLTKSSLSTAASQSHQSIAPLFPQHCARCFHRALCYQTRGTTKQVYDATARKFSTGNRLIKVPTMGDSISEGTLNEWKKQVGDQLEEDDVVAVIDTDKVSLDINSPQKGTLLEIKFKAGDTVAVGDELFIIGPPEEGASGKENKSQEIKKEKIEDSTPLASSQQETETEAKQSSTPPIPAKAQPECQSQSKHKTETPPSTPVADNTNKKKAPQQPELTPSQALPPSYSSYQSQDRTERRVPMTRLRLRVAERLKSSQEIAASLTTFQECDMGNLMAMRSELNEDFVKTHGMKFGFVSAFLYASSRALMKMPVLNSYIDPQTNKDIIYKDFVDISVAVATPSGLLVPVIRDCEKKTVAQLEGDLVAIASKARTGKIALEEMVGGTFTISNGGVFGSLFGTPILNPPQSSILGLHSIKERAVVKDGEVVVRPIMYLALTYDHRVIDGREAVIFLNTIKMSIEDPRRLLLDI